jgi:2-polyprenyl-3-methyl-5-hydroxy-6-metoxy-1,4-benzoquinol methylase
MNVVRQTWNRKADEWADFARNENNYWTRRLNAVAALASKHAPLGRALDVGCGPGVLCRLLAGVGFDVNGVDISENMIQKAKESLSECLGDVDGRLYHSPDGNLPFDPAEHQFRLIAALSVLEYVADRRSFVKRLTGLLEPGGCLILSNTNNVSLFITLSVGSRILRFWPTRTWYETIRNLVRTGIWSGGHIDFKKADKVYGARALDQLAIDLDLQVVDALDFFNLSWLDRNPLRRSKLGRRLARQWGWNHVGFYRKPFQATTERVREVRQ